MSSTISTTFGVAALAPRRRLRVAIDMDEVIADSLGKHLRLYKQVFGHELDRRDLDGRTLEEAVPPAHLATLSALERDPGFFRDLEEIEGSREVVRELAEHHEVFIATAAMEIPTSFAAKYAWLRERFPFIPPSHIVFCGDKGVLDVDCLIDDTPRHFLRFRGTPVLFSAPHNLHEHRYHRVRGWSEVRPLLLGP
jgi:5'-nucleotidase